MAFKVGMTVVYPHHGAAEIIEKAERTLRGETKMYLHLKVVQTELTIWVPESNVQTVGVRHVIDKAGLEKVYDVLRMDIVEEATNWSRRFKANAEKLSTGDVSKVSEVVRDLWRRDQDRGLSAGEKRMLAKARQILESELKLALNITPELATVKLDEVLASA
jgi:CarD family transcriptional regulator